MIYIVTGPTKLLAENPEGSGLKELTLKTKNAGN